MNVEIQITCGLNIGITLLMHRISTIQQPRTLIIFQINFWGTRVPVGVPIIIMFILDVTWWIQSKPISVCLSIYSYVYLCHLVLIESIIYYYFQVNVLSHGIDEYPNSWTSCCVNLSPKRALYLIQIILQYMYKYIAAYHDIVFKFKLFCISWIV